MGQEDRPDGLAEPGPRDAGLKDRVATLTGGGDGASAAGLCRPEEIENAGPLGSRVPREHRRAG